MADAPLHAERKVTIKKERNVNKKTRNPEEWHKQKQKRLRISGKEHTSTSGKIIPAKEPGMDCNCKRRCFQRVPEEIRLKTFQGFYSMKSHDEQNAYLFGLMRQIDIKRKRVRDSTRRTCTFEYFIRVRGRETQVCQTAFKNIHAITERKVRVLCKKMDDGVMFPSDNRGKNSTKRTGGMRLAPEILEQIKVHIFNIVHTNKLKDFIRLDKVSGLEINIAKMWKDYVKTYDPQNYEYATKNGVTQKNQLSNPVEQSIPVQSFQLQAPENYGPIYPGSGHLINIAENYFQTQYCNQPTNHANMNQVNYYPVTVATGGPNVDNGNGLDNNHSRVLGSGPTILMYTTSEVTVRIDDPLRIDDSLRTNEPLRMDNIEKKQRNKKKRGPLVKQWRYTSVFHEEINGVALNAIKTRLGLYYSESEIAKKKNNKNQPEEVPQQAPPPVNILPHPNSTIAFINIHATNPAAPTSVPHHLPSQLPRSQSVAQIHHVQ